MTALMEFHDYEARLRCSTSAFLCFRLARGDFSKPYQALDGFFTSFALVDFLFILF